MSEVEEKVNYLEDMMGKLIQAQFNTQMNLDRLSTDLRRTELSIENLSKEVKDFKTHTQNTIDNLSNEMKDFKNEMKKDRNEMNKKWGELSNRWGTILEDMVIPNIQSVGSKYFNLPDCEDFMTKRTRKNSKDKSRSKEFDVIAVYDTRKIILNETKATPKQDYMESFISFIRNNEFYDFFPEYTGYELIPIFSTLYFKEENIKFLSKNKIYALGIKEDTMDILNPNF